MNITQDPAAIDQRSGPDSDAVARDIAGRDGPFPDYAALARWHHVSCPSEESPATEQLETTRRTKAPPRVVLGEADRTPLLKVAIDPFSTVQP